MKTFTELIRSVADYLGLRTNLISVEFNQACNPNYYVLAHKRFPTAYFTAIGTCSKDNGPRFDTVALSDAISKSLPYAHENALIVLSYGDLKTASIAKKDAEIFCNLTRSFISNLYNQYNLRPVIIHREPKDFLEDTQISKNEVIMVRYKIPNEAMLDQIEKLSTNKPLLFSRETVAAIDALMLMMFLYQAYKIYSSRAKTNKVKLKMG